VHAARGNNENGTTGVPARVRTGRGTDGPKRDVLAKMGRVATVTKHFGPKTLRYQDTSALGTGQFGT